MSLTPIIGATEWGAAQASPWVPHNAALRLLEAMARSAIIEDRDLTAPPVSCADGACYLVKATGTGAWASHDGALAVAVGADAANGWYFIVVAVEGVEIYVRDEDIKIRHNGAAWVTIPSGGTAAGLDSDTDGTLAANSDGKIATQKATKTYVDAKLAGLSWKQAVRAATTSNHTLATAYANGSVVDGVTLATGDRVLIKNQTTGSENGIYIVPASGAPSRASDADSGAELVNASVYVSEGTTNADTQWTCTTNAAITVGTTALAFAQLTSAGGALVAANNLSDVASASTARSNLAAAAHDPSIQAVTSSATVTPTFSDDQVNITAQAAGLTLANPTGTAVPAWGIVIRIKDNGTARAIAYGTQYRAIGVTLPSTTVVSKTLYLGMVYNSTDTKWDVIAVAQEA